jgi:hypothetical protein
MTDYLVFVSGTTSTAPISNSDPEFIASTSVAYNESGSTNWTNLGGHIYNWHAYINSDGTWSNATDSNSFTVRGYNKFLLAYRNGANDAGNPTSYRVCSGTSISSWEIDLFSPDDSSECAYACTAFRDSFNRMWYSMHAWKNDVGNDWGAGCALYTYPESCNSWKGGWDYWFYPNGTVAGSGNSSTDVRKGAGNELNWAAISSNQAGPQVKHLKDGDSYRQGTGADFNVLPNGELGCVVRNETNAGELKFFYMSNQIDWANPLTTDWCYKRTDNVCLAPASSMIGVIYASGDISELRCFSSSDNGRTFFNSGLVYTADRFIHTVYSLEPRDSKTGGCLPDNYFRIAVNLINNPAEWPWSSQVKILKINAEDYSDLSIVTVASSGSSFGPSGGGYYLGAKRGGCLGGYWDGLTIWGIHYNPGNTIYNEGEQGDPRAIAWWNENTGDSGSKMFDESSGWLWGSHCATSVRFDDEGYIWCVGAAYFDATEGGDAYKGQDLPPDICSGTTDPNGSYLEQYADVDTSAGGIGCGLLVFR